MIYNYKTEEKSLKDFRNDQNPIELFKNLEDGNVNPREILKIKIRTSNKCNTKCWKCFWDKRKKYWLFCYLKLNIKQNMEKDEKY